MNEDQSMTNPPDIPAYERLKGPQRKFVDLLLTGLTGAEAVRRIRPRLKRPDGLAWKWRTTRLVREAIEQRTQDAMEAAGITAADIILDINNVSKVSAAALYWQEGEKEGVAAGTLKKLHELDEITARAIQSVKFGENGALEDVRFVDKIAAKRMLAQNKKLLTESHEVNLGEQTLDRLAAASWNRPKPVEE